MIPASFTEETARNHFLNTFEINFDRALRPLNLTDRRILQIVSQKLWKSTNVQRASNPYHSYESLFIEFFIGTSMVFRDHDGSFYQDLEHASEERTSSHYGRVGSEVQRHHRGSALPEVLFHRGMLPFAEGKIKGGIYWKKLPDDHRNNYDPIPAVWIQTENTPNGPKISDWFIHRWDFVIYFFLKEILKSDRPQIGPYKTIDGLRGKPDTNPVFVDELPLEETG